jgi:hypothetical protein
MGEAKRRRLAGDKTLTVYHHTSTLRSNLIWMSGVIELEGRSPPVYHPRLGEIRTDALARRSMKDFAPLVWFTTQTSVPQCLVKTSILFIDKVTRKAKQMDVDSDMGNAMALHRIAIGFRVGDVSVVPWIDHLGYRTAEGAVLNETAIEAGDDPRHWYVSEQPVDVLKSSEVWSSRSIMNPKLERWDWYLKDIHNMVRMCRERKDTFIAPAWLTTDEAKMLAVAMGVPAFSGDTDPEELPPPKVFATKPLT